jgi:uncharacterized protein DUF4349
MRRLDDSPLDPEIAAQLDAVDATLAGQPVDPEHAELAELALLLAAERPGMDPEFARSLDQRVQRRFAASAGAASSSRRRAWALKPMLGVAGSALAAVVVVVVVTSSGGSGVQRSATSSAQQPSAPPARLAAPAVAQSTTSAAGASAPSAASGSGQLRPDAVQPPANGRKITQSAQLALSAAPTRIDAVAQEVFDVIGRENGVVKRSNVTATGGSDGYAEFQLSVPSSALADTMASLSRLHYAHVSSRTDTTQDVNDAYVATARRLADDRALRTALLKQLANATTQSQINSLNSQLHGAEAAIAGDQATLRSMNRQINNSQITLTINAALVPVARGSSSFTIGKAAHDAGRVLTIAAGVALITLAVLVPIGIVGAFAWWSFVATRRRRREQALDMA